MGKTLNWVLALQDNLSAPAARASSSLAKLSKAHELAERTFSRSLSRAGTGDRFRMFDIGRTFNRAADPTPRISRMARGAEMATGYLSTMGSTLLGIGRIAVGAAGGIGGLGVAFGRSAVDAIQFREQAMTTLRQVLRSDSAAQEVFAESQQIARQTPFETQDVVNERVRLIAAGFSRDQSRTLQAGISDIRALFGDNSADQLTNAFERIRSGGLTGEVLEELRGSRVGTSEIIQQLATAAGIQGTNPDELQRRVLQAARTGRIQNAAIIGAILDRVQGQTHADTLGAFARQRGGESFAGAISNLRSAFGDLLASGDITGLGGTSALVGGISRLTEVLSDANPLGQRLRATLYGIVDAAGRFAGGFLSGGGAERMLGALVTGIDRLWKGFQYVAPLASALFRGLGTGLAPLAAVLGRLFGTISTGQSPTQRMIAGFEMFGRVLGYVGTAGAAIGAVVFGVGAVLGGVLVGGLTFAIAALTQFYSWLVGLPNVFTDLNARVTEFGAQLIQGFVDGLLARWSMLRESIVGVFTDVVGTAASVLQIKSPSRVFMELGAYTAEGFSMGLEGGARDVNAAMGAMLAPPAAGALGGAAGAGAGATITIMIDGSGDPASTGRAVVGALADFFGITAPEPA